MMCKSAADNRRKVEESLLEACENAYTHIAIARHFDETSGEADVRILQELEQAIRAAGGRVIGADGKEVK